MEEDMLEKAAEETAESTEAEAAEEKAENAPTEREQMLEDKLFCIQNGVPEENCGVVIAAASAMGKADRKAAIAEVLEKFPFFKPAQSAVGDRSNITTGIHIEGMQGSVISGVEEAFFAANPDCR